jgi:hypothetical protein
VDGQSFIEFLCVLAADRADEFEKARAKPSPPFGPAGLIVVGGVREGLAG